jgi:hypothetical protein
MIAEKLKKSDRVVNQAAAPASTNPGVATD